MTKACLLLLLVAAAFQAGNTLTCYSCDSTSPYPCIAAVNFTDTIMCEKDTDVCYSTLTGGSGSDIEYGCISPEKCEKDFNCATCSKDHCNDEAYKPLSCFVCDSAKNRYCGYDFEEDNVSLVKDCGFFGNFARTCYTRMDPDTNLVRRGCDPYSTGDTCRGTEECEMCTTNKCNGKSEENEVKCFKCDPIMDEHCADDVIADFPINMTVTCSNVFKDPLCYKWTLYGLSYRGCTARNTTDFCRTPKIMDTCDLCKTNTCNSSSQLVPSFVLYLMVLIIASIYRC